MSEKITTARVLAFAGLKGGIGKTTIAVLIACWYAITHNLRVLLVDADASSQTAYDWHKGAKKLATKDTTCHPLPIDIEIWPTAAVGDLIEEKLEKYDLVIVDIGGAGNEILKSVMRVADHLVIAMTPKQADLARLSATLKSGYEGATDHGRAHNIAMDIVLTQVDSRRNGRKNRKGDYVPGHNDAVRTMINDKDYPLLDSAISLWPSGYPDVFGRNPFDEDVNLDMCEIEALAKELDIMGVPS